MYRLSQCPLPSVAEVQNLAMTYSVSSCSLVSLSSERGWWGQRGRWGVRCTRWLLACIRGAAGRRQSQQPRGTLPQHGFLNTAHTAVLLVFLRFQATSESLDWRLLFSLPKIVWYSYTKCERVSDSLSPHGL